jgi:hypothetical protein
VVFACGQMVCYESQGGSEHAEDDLSLKTYSARSLESAWFDSLALIAQNITWGIGTLSIWHQQNKRRRLKGLWELIVEYSNRDLTFDSDALRALAGICRVFEKGECPIYNLQGLPIVPFTEAGHVPNTMKLVSALCWHHDAPRKARRRMQFPSWTWAGWTSRIEHPDCTETEVEFEIPSEDIKIEYEDGFVATLVDLSKNLKTLHMETSRSRHFNLSGWGNHNMPDKNDKERDWTNPSKIVLHAPAVTAKYFSFPDAKKWDGGNLLGSELQFEADRHEDKMNFSPIEFGKGLANGALGCILLRVDRKEEGFKYHRAHMLLFEWLEGKYAHRIGKLTTKQDSRSYSQMFRLCQLYKHLNWIEVRLS